MKADGSTQNNLTNGDAFDGDPAWSPSGRRIAFGTSRDGNDEVYTVRADGSAARNVTIKPSNPDQNPSWQAR